jgi:hypothetical protein
MVKNELKDKNGVVIRAGMYYKATDPVGDGLEYGKITAIDYTNNYPVRVDVLFNVNKDDRNKSPNKNNGWSIHGANVYLEIIDESEVQAWNL